MASEKRRISSFNTVLVIQLVIMMLLSAGISAAISVKTQDSSAEHMTTLALERSEIIKNYVDYAEKTLSAYSHADQIIQVLQNPTNSARVQAAQNYTEVFSDDIPNLEGIYVSEWTSKVIAHTDSDQRGLVTRKTEASLLELQKAIEDAGDGVYDTGIIISPASGKQIISMYKGIRDSNNKYIGLVGLGLYTDNLVKTLDDISRNGNENFKYSMINIQTHSYIFSNEKDVFTTDSEGKTVAATVHGQNINEICNDIIQSNDKSKRTGIFKSDDSGEKTISAYYLMHEKYMGSNGWMFIITEPQKEYYSLTQTLIIYLVVFALFCILIAVIFSFINKKQEETNRKLSSAVKKNEKTKETLNTALFNDILTDANNRVSFSTDFGDGKIKDAPDYPYYFAMFNIIGFSELNINYGTEFGDLILVNTANHIRNAFSDGTLYRTGSDEFVVTVQTQNSNAGFSDIQTKMKNAITYLTAPVKTESGQITINYTTAVVKKSKNINAGVITTLQDISNRNGATQIGQFNFIDLDNQ